MSPAQQSVREEELAALKECVADLTETEQQVLEFRYRLGYTLEEIAQLLRKAKSTVEGNLKRAKNKLRKCMERKGLGE